MMLKLGVITRTLIAIFKPDYDTLTRCTSLAINTFYNRCIFFSTRCFATKLWSTALQILSKESLVEKHSRRNTLNPYTHLLGV
jgi:hypothetical protein